MKRRLTILVLFSLLWSGCRLFRPCPSCPEPLPASPPTVVEVRRPCMTALEPALRFEFPPANDDGTFTLTTADAGEVLRLLQYVNSQLARCKVVVDASP